MKIEVRHLSYQTGSHMILPDINICFEGNRICGIIGPNGSGKTTLLKHIYRQLPSNGTIFMNGRDVSRIPGRAFARQVAVMMQHQDLVESDMTVFDVVRTGRYPYQSLFSRYSKKDDAIISRILEENGILPYRDRTLSTLSGGELQRVMICRCFAQEPDVIILDEPTNHLDIRHKLELMQILSGFEGLVIMTLHDLTLAAQFCDVIHVLDKGRLAASGSPAQIMTEQMLSRVFKANVPVRNVDGHIFVGV